MRIQVLLINRTAKGMILLDYQHCCIQADHHLSNLMESDNSFILAGKADPLAVASAPPPQGNLLLEKNDKL